MKLCLLLTVLLLNWKFSSPLSGGSGAQNGQFPFTVAIFINDILVGTGVLYNPVKVLTVAHAVAVQDTSSLRVVAGSVDWTDTSCATCQSSHVASVVLHPDFVNDPTQMFPHNVAVLTLASPINTNQYTSYATLASTGNVPTVGVFGTVAGWGCNANGGQQTILQTGQVQISASPACDSATGSLNAKLCAMTFVAFCDRDSGDPLINLGVVTGLFSYCGPEPGFDWAVLINVGFYFSWIDQQ